MAVKLQKHVSTKKTPQSEAIFGENQVKNNAGGYVYEISDWKQLERFLVLGTEGGTYYATESKLTKDNAKTILNLIKSDGPKVVKTLAEFSDAGKAYKNDYAIFVLALAMAYGNDATKQAVRAEFKNIIRIGTHLFMFAEYVKELRGFGRSLRKTLAKWYTSKSDKDIAYQITKYQQRGEWSHIDILNVAHPYAPEDSATNALFNYIINGGKEAKPNKGGNINPLTVEVHSFLSGKKVRASKKFNNEAWAYVRAVEEAKTANEKRLIELIKEFDLPREVIPTEKLTANVYRAMIPKMPMTALIRNLATFTRLEILKPLAPEVRLIVERLTNVEQLKKGRIHPIQILAALLTYKSGRGARNTEKTWTPVQQIVDALDESFYLSFDAIEPSGKNFMLGIDISGSMDCGTVGGVPGLTPRIASAVLAMVTARTEKNNLVAGFTSGSCIKYSAVKRGRYTGGAEGLTELNITPRMRLDSVVTELSKYPFGGTDCSLPMRYAMDKNLDVDTFVIYTDNETWAGEIHASQALKEYRKKMNKPNAKMIVVGMTATGFSIADPKDPLMLDVVGMSIDTPAVISDFSKG